MPLEQIFLFFITGIFFIIILMSCLGIYQFIRRGAEQKRVIAKIRKGRLDNTSFNEQLTSEYENSKNKKPFLSFLSRLGGKSNQDALLEDSTVNFKFLKAGIKRKDAEAILWGAKLFFLICLPLIFLILRLTVFKITSNPHTIGISVLLALIGFYAPDLWLRNKIDHRKERLLKALPDALDLLVICVEAGMGIDSAFNRVAQEIKLSCPDLGNEFDMINLELRAGKLRKDALKNFALRTDLDEIKGFVTLLIQTDKFGTSVATALKVYSDSFRTQRFQRAEELAAKVAVKILFPLILFIFPSMFVVLLGPAAIKIYQNIILR